VVSLIEYARTRLGVAHANKNQFSNEWLAYEDPRIQNKPRKR
jgi:hypothetical protein